MATKVGFQLESSLASKHLTDAEFIKGSYLVVSNITEMNSLPVATDTVDGVIVEGSLCYCQEDNKFYIYNGSSWVEKEFGVTTEATDAAAGLMSADDKKKLAGIEVGANKITVDSTLSDTSTNPVQNKVVKAALDKFIAKDADSLALGYQLTAAGEYSAAFNKGLIGSETKASILGYDIDVNDILTKGVNIVAVDTANNTLDIYGTYEVKVLGFTVYTLTIADAFEYAMGANPKFIVEVANTHKLPVIASEKVTVSGKEHARLHIHKSVSISDITTSQKVTNFYAGYVDARNSMAVNNLNVVLGEHSFASGSNNLNIGHSTHTQNNNNIASGDAGSAAGNQTEAGVTAFSTGHKTKALGESSFTFGIRSETAYTESMEKEGGKGSIAGGYQAIANAPYSAAFGIDTHADSQGQFVCGLSNVTDTGALFIVGKGSGGENAMAVRSGGTLISGNLAVGPTTTVVSGSLGATATGNRTKAKGESSLTFGIGSETAETIYGDTPVDGGKGAIAGGYEAKANARFSAAFGVSTHSDREGQLVCGLSNVTDTGALFLVGGGNKNLLTVKTTGDGYFTGDIYTKGVKVATVNDITSSGSIANGEGTGAVKVGDRTHAYADYSLAGGETSETTAGAKACLAFGISTKAQANASAAFGWRTIATNENQLVVGRCNSYNGWDQALFVVGNGTADDQRSNAFIVNGNGDVRVHGHLYVAATVSATTFTATSDARLKENFRDIQPLGSILDLPTYKYDFIDGPKNQIGCKAQDLKEICPEIVTEQEDGYLSIQESKIVYLLLEEVKKLRNELNQIKLGVK